MKVKPLKDLAPDLRNVLAEASRQTAIKVTTSLKKEGPYWTGQFERAWEVQVGQVGIPELLEDEIVLDVKGWQYKGMDVSEPLNRVITPPFVPAPNGLNGYTIGNLMEYRDEAMDRVDGIRKMSRRRTAQLNWFFIYMKGFGAYQDIKTATESTFKKAGWTR